MNEIKEFSTYLLHLKNYSLLTIKAYQNDLKIFFVFLDYHDFDFLQINENNIRLFIKESLNENISRRTLRRRLSSLKQFYHFLVQEKKIENNPFLLLAKQKTEYRYPRVLSKEEIFLILDENIKREQPETLRDQVILEILFGSGLRVSELVHLQLSDLDLNHRIIKVLGKGNKERLVPINESTKKYLLQYLELREKSKNPQNQTTFLLLNNQGMPLTSRGVQYILKTIEKEIKINSPLHPHLFRHSFATYLIHQGADLFTVKELLGHKTINTTKVYTHLSNSFIKESYLSSHPRSKKRNEE